METWEDAAFGASGRAAVSSIGTDTSPAHLLDPVPAANTTGETRASGTAVSIPSGALRWEETEM